MPDTAYNTARDLAEVDLAPVARRPSARRAELRAPRRPIVVLAEIEPRQDARAALDLTSIRARSPSVGACGWIDERDLHGPRR